MIKKITQWLPYAAILVAMMLWGTSTIATKLALQTFPPILLVTLRFLLASVLMFLFGITTHTLQRLQRKDVLLFILGGAIQPFLYYILETYGLRLIATPTLAEVILSTVPLFAPFFAWLLLREKVTHANIWGIILSTAGVLVMILAGGTQFVASSPWAYILLLGAVFAAVFYTIVLKKIPSHYNNLTIVFYVQLFGTLLFIPTFCIVDLPQIDTFVWNWEGFGAIIYLAVFCSIICYILFCYCVRKIGVTRTNAFNNIRPVFTALYMLIFFGEQLALVKWIGIFLVVIGLFVSSKKES